MVLSNRRSFVLREHLQNISSLEYFLENKRTKDVHFETSRMSIGKRSCRPLDSMETSFPTDQESQIRFPDLLWDVSIVKLPMVCTFFFVVYCLYPCSFLYYLQGRLLHSADYRSEEDPHLFPGSYMWSIEISIPHIPIGAIKGS